MIVYRDKNNLWQINSFCFVLFLFWLFNTHYTVLLLFFSISLKKKKKTDTTTTTINIIIVIVVVGTVVIERGKNIIIRLLAIVVCYLDLI